MATNPSKDYVRQPDPRGTPGDMSSTQSLINQSWDPTFRTLINQIVGTSDGVNMYKLAVTSGGAIPVVNPDGSTISGGSGGGTFTVANANNSYGQSLALSNAATGTLVNIASSALGYKITGFSCTGNGDGYFFVSVAGVTILSGRTRAGTPNVVVILPNPIIVATASAVTLKVTNESGSTADFEGTLLGA